VWGCCVILKYQDYQALRQIFNTAQRGRHPTYMDEQEHPKEVGTAMKRAVIGGHLEVMKWLKEDGCPV